MQYASIKMRIESLSLLTDNEQDFYIGLMEDLGKRGSLNLNQNKQINELLRRSEERAKTAYPPNRYGRKYT